ncbi:MAG TPA: archaeal proteasome endopeptidase complex subunit beta [Candidatus Aenigmarchaeota archaeon]|nr:archaeal proteasome endopeptidase complex subunit beta [Candidatus Aenigmarchaeota archaeon]
MEDVKKTGTTTVGLVYDGDGGGVVLGSEKKATMGYLVDSIKARKIYPIDERIGITTAGNVGDIQTIVRYLKAESNIYRLQKGERISTRALTILLANILQGSKYFPYLGQFIIGGYDESGPKIFSLDPFGGVVEGDNYYATGSGSPVAFGVLEDQYREGMKRDEAVKLVIKAITAATKRDIASGGEVAIAVIDKNGYRELSEKEIKLLV